MLISNLINSPIIIETERLANFNENDYLVDINNFSLLDNNNNLSIVEDELSKKRKQTFSNKLTQIPDKNMNGLHNLNKLNKMSKLYSLKIHNFYAKRNRL
jgi:hypothetical protein